MYRKLFKIAVTILTILTAKLIASLITEKLVSYKWELKPLSFTLVAMVIITVVFYPLFIKLEKWLNKFSKRFVQAGHSFTGRYIGLFLMFFAGLLILTFFYARLWYNINVFELIISGKFLNYF